MGAVGLDGVLSSRRQVGAWAINGGSRWHVVGGSKWMCSFRNQWQGAMNMDRVKWGKVVYICRGEVG